MELARSGPSDFTNGNRKHGAGVLRVLPGAWGVGNDWDIFCFFLSRKMTSGGGIA